MPGIKLQESLQRLDDHEKRIRALEGDVDTALHKKPSRNRQGNYSGAIGGVRFILRNGFYKSKKNQASIRKELADKGYHYSSQAIYEALKILSKPGGPLVVLKEEGRKVYVERK